MVRGQSHAKRIAAHEALAAGCGTVLVSDYYYPSMLHAVYRLIRDHGWTLPDAWRLVSTRPARAAQLADRGELGVGARADLTIVDDRDPALPVVVATIVAGRMAFATEPAWAPPWHAASAIAQPAA